MPITTWLWDSATITKIFRFRLQVVILTPHNTMPITQPESLMSLCVDSMLYVSHNDWWSYETNIREKKKKEKRKKKKRKTSA